MVQQFGLKENYKKDNKNFRCLNIDIRNYNKLEKNFKKYRKNISLIIHCAAQPSHDYGKKFS